MYTSQFTEERMKNLKPAFQELIGYYMLAIETTGNLPFFVNIYGFGEQPKSTRLFGKYTTTIYEDFRGWSMSLLSWRPIMRLFVESHIRSKLDEFEIIFTQIGNVIPAKNKKTKAWLLEQKILLDETKRSLQSWRSVRAGIYLFVTFILGLLFQLIGGNNIFKAVLIFINNSIATIPVNLTSLSFLSNVLSIEFIALVLIAFFTTPYLIKYQLFLETVNEEGENIYKLEEKLHTLLGRRWETEFPVANLLFSIFHLVIFITVAYFLPINLIVLLMLIGIGQFAIWRPWIRQIKIWRLHIILGEKSLK